MRVVQFCQTEGSSRKWSARDYSRGGRERASAVSRRDLGEGGKEKPGSERMSRRPGRC
jgi:hypothetical protein